MSLGVHVDRPIATLRRLTEKELEELPAEKLLAMDGLAPLTTVCKHFDLNAKQIRNAARFLSEEEQLEQLGMICIPEPSSNYHKVFLVMRKVKDLIARFKPEKPEYLSLAEHDFVENPDPPEGWYRLAEILHYYPLLREQLGVLKQSEWFRGDFDLVHLPGALTLFEA